MILKSIDETEFHWDGQSCIVGNQPPPGWAAVLRTSLDTLERIVGELGAGNPDREMKELANHLYGIIERIRKLIRAATSHTMEDLASAG